MDDDYIDTQLLMTQAIDELMVTGRDQLQTVYFYAERTYPGNKAILSYFGKDRYEVARKNPLKLHDLMLKCYEAAIEADYKDALLTKLTQATLDSMKILPPSSKINTTKEINIIEKLRRKTQSAFK